MPWCLLCAIQTTVNLSTQTASECSRRPLWHWLLQAAYEAILYAVFNLLPYKAAYFTYVGCNFLLLQPCYLLALASSQTRCQKGARSGLLYWLRR